MTLSTIDSKISSVVHSKHFSTFMLICLMSYALLKIASRVSADVFQTIFVIGSIAAIYVDRKIILKDKMLICLLLSLILQVLSWINAIVQLPQLAQSSPAFGPLGNLFFFIFIAYWLKGSAKSVYLLWFSMIIGFILTFYLYSPNFVQEVIQGLNGKRIDFNVNNAQHPALWSGVAFILLSYFTIKYIYLGFTSHKIKRNLLIAFGLSIPNLFFIFVLYATQTRQVFLGLIISFVFTSIIYVFFQKNRPSFKIILPLILLFITSLIAMNNIQGLANKTSREGSTYKAFIEGDINQVPYNNSGIRIHVWYESLSWIKARPILGSDQKVRDDVIFLSEHIPDRVRYKTKHLHNSFIETTLSYGVLGLTIVLFMFYWVLHSTSKSTQLGKFNEIRLLALLLLVYWFVVNNFESYLFSSTGLLVHNIIFGSLYTFYFTQQLEKRKNETTL